MAKENSSGSSGGVGFVSLLTLLFIGLKLTHYVAWSWWWVLSPMWIAFGIWAAIMAVGVALLLVAAVLDR